MAVTLWREINAQVPHALFWFYTLPLVIMSSWASYSLQLQRGGERNARNPLWVAYIFAGRIDVYPTIGDALLRNLIAVIPVINLFVCFVQVAALLLVLPGSLYRKSRLEQLLNRPYC